MLQLEFKNLVKKLIFKFFNNLTKNHVGSLIFYKIIIRRGFGEYYIDWLSGNNLKLLIKNVFNRLAINNLRILCDKSKTIEEIVDLGFSYSFSLHSIPKFERNRVYLIVFQKKTEIIELLTAINKIKPKFILEIGTATCGTLFLISRFSSSKAVLISVDLNRQTIINKNPLFFRSIGKKKQRIELIKGNSHDPLVFKKIKKILNNQRLDLLFIDGDHSYEGVKKDFEIYASLVKPGGLICIHDIVPGPYEDVGRVPDFWNEIKERYDTREIVKDWDQQGFGIGMIFMG